MIKYLVFKKNYFNGGYVKEVLIKAVESDRVLFEGRKVKNNKGYDIVICDNFKIAKNVKKEMEKLLTDEK